MVIRFILLLIGAYLLGSVPAAYLVAKWRRGIDIRHYGSGNVGASNVLAAVSKPWSVAVMIFDVGKGALPVWLAQLAGFGASQQAIIGIAAIMGHNWTVFLHFQGGRGISTSLGVATLLAPRVGPVALVVAYLFAPFHQLSLGVLITLVALPILALSLSQPLAIAAPAPVSLAYLAILLLALFRRLTVPRSPISASVPTGELILYRLLFDRDIKDRKAWISQTRTEASSTK